MFWVPDYGRLVNKEVLVPEVLTLNCFGGFYGYFCFGANNKNGYFRATI